MFSSQSSFPVPSIFHPNIRYAQECADKCSKRNENFFWCHLKSGGWDYCSPKKPRHSPSTRTTLTTLTKAQREKGEPTSWLWLTMGILAAVVFLFLVTFKLQKYERKRGTLKKKRAEKREKELTEDLPKIQGDDIVNDSFVPEVPSAPPLHPPIPTCEADEEPAMTQLIAQLLSSTVEKIAREKAGLECPVCLETANIPIYTCPKQHLICSECRPQVIYCVCQQKIFNIAFCTFVDRIAVSIFVIVELTLTSMVL